MGRGGQRRGAGLPAPRPPLEDVRELRAPLLLCRGAALRRAALIGQSRSPTQGARVFRRRTSSATCAPSQARGPSRGGASWTRFVVDARPLGHSPVRRYPHACPQAGFSGCNHCTRLQPAPSPQATMLPDALGAWRPVISRTGPRLREGTPSNSQGKPQRPGLAARWPPPPPGGVATWRLRRAGTFLQSLSPMSTHTQTNHEEAGSVPGHRPDPTPASPNGASRQRSLVTQHTPGVTSPRPATATSRQACPPTLPESGSTATPQGLLTTHAGHPCV